MPSPARPRPFGPTAPALVAAALWAGAAAAQSGGALGADDAPVAVPAVAPAALPVRPLPPVAPAVLAVPAPLATARPMAADDGVAPAAAGAGAGAGDDRTAAPAERLPGASDRLPPVPERITTSTDRLSAEPSAVPVPAAPRPPATMRDDAVAATLWSLVEQSQRLVRSYAQLGTEVRAASAASAVSDALRAGDRLIATLASGGQRRVAPARVREIDLRWRALRDGVGTRPSPEIARLMDEAARQLGALAADAAAALPPASRATRQRTLLHRMAGAHLLACWGALPAAPAALIAMRAEFGHLLAEGADGGAGELDAATLANQWGLLADGLDGHGPPCDAAVSARVASTADRLAQLLDPAAPRPFAARRP